MSLINLQLNTLWSCIVLVYHKCKILRFYSTSHALVLPVQRKAATLIQRESIKKSETILPHLIFLLQLGPL